MRSSNASKVVAILSVCLVAAACAGSDISSDSGSSPLAAYLGVQVGGGSGDLAIADLDGRNDAIRACMREQGFEWHPADPQVGQVASAEELSIEWAGTNGLGISTRALEQQGLPASLVGRPPGSSWTYGTAERDPNAEYVASLSVTEQDAYLAALYGQPDLEVLAEIEAEEGADAAIEYMNEVAGKGCAQAAPIGDSERIVRELNAELGAELEDLQERVLSDNRLLRFEAVTQRCMIERGWTYEGREQLGSSFYEQTYEIVPALDTDSDGVLDPGAETRQEIRMLEELQASEIGFSLALFECEGDRASFQRLYQEISAEYEESFVSEHRGILDDIVRGP